MLQVFAANDGGAELLRGLGQHAARGGVARRVGGPAAAPASGSRPPRQQIAAGPGHANAGPYERGCDAAQTQHCAVHGSSGHVEPHPHLPRP